MIESASSWACGISRFSSVQRPPLTTDVALRGPEILGFEAGGSANDAIYAAAILA